MHLSRLILIAAILVTNCGLSAALDSGPSAQRTGPIAIVGEGPKELASGFEVVPSGADAPLSLAALMAQIAPAQAYGVKCDGVTDDTAKLARASGLSPMLLLPRGTCIVSGAQLAPNAQVLGQGDATVLKTRTGAALAIALGTGSTLSRVRIDGNASAQTGASDCIVANGVSQATIDNVSISNCFRHGVSFLNARQSTVRNSRFHTIGVGPGSAGNGVHWENSNGLLIADNLIAAVVYANIGDAGSVGGSSDIKIERNTLDGYTTGIYLGSLMQGGFLDPAQAFSKGVTITHNTIRNLSGHGTINVAPGTVFSFNRVVDVGDPGNRTHFTNQGFVGPGVDAIVTHNTFENIGGDGIDMGGAKRCVVSHNKIGDVNTYAVELASAQYCSVSDNLVYGETWRTTNAAGNAAVKSAMLSSYDYGNTLAPTLRMPSLLNKFTGNTVLKRGRTERAIEVKDPGDETSAKGTLIFANVAPGFGAGTTFTNGSPSTTILSNTTDDAATALGAWTPYTPAVSCAVGTLSGTVTAVGQYLVIGRTVLYQIGITVPAKANGTCSNTLLATLPRRVGAKGAQTAVGSGPGAMLVGATGNGGLHVGIRNYDQTYPVPGGMSNEAVTMSVNGQFIAD
ncbi:right-handed parallel beta-helix repeat-containing protein [Methylorubrum aminovorans]